MHKTFYQFLMTKRNPGSTDPVAEFANNAFYDQSFPKQEDEFDALSKYLEETRHICQQWKSLIQSGQNIKKAFRK